MTAFAAVVYDIPDDRRRTQVARILEGHLYRVQRSVFEGHLTAGQLKRLEGMPKGYTRAMRAGLDGGAKGGDHLRWIAILTRKLQPSL